MNSDLKNVARGSFNETKIDDGFIVLTYQNENHTIEVVEREIESSFIQFHFCLKGSSKFIFNHGRYTLDILEENSLLLYNPQRDLPIHLEVHPNSWLVSVLRSEERRDGKGCVS